MHARLLLPLVLVTLVGCNGDKKAGLELTASHVPPPDYAYESDVIPLSDSTAAYAAPSYDSYSSVREPIIAETTGFSAGGSDRVHVVQPRDTLIGLSRTYYGSASQWKKIYAANQNQLADPNRIRVGMRLVIP